MVIRGHVYDARHILVRRWRNPAVGNDRAVRARSLEVLGRSHHLTGSFDLALAAGQILTEWPGAERGQLGPPEAKFGHLPESAEIAAVHPAAVGR